MTTEAEAIAALAVKAAEPTVVTNAAGRQFLVTPEGYGIREITDPNALPSLAPSHIRQGVVLQTVDSLVDYVNRFKTPDTVLFADIETNTISAALDYHAPEKAGMVAHSSRLALPFSVEWKTWAAMDGKMVSQLAFARFLEENAADVAAPSGAELLDVCRDLQAVRKVDFKKAVRTQTDNEDFEYSDETTTTGRKGHVEVPTKFALRIPVYFGGASTELYAFLRWKLDEGSLTLGVALHRAEHVRQAVFKMIVLEAADRTDQPAVFGRLS